MHRTLAVVFLILGSASLGPNRALALLPTGFGDEFLAFIDGRGPVGLEFLPDGRVVIADQVSHTLRLYRFGFPGTALIDTVDGAYGFAEEGLLGVAVNPDWPLEPYIYVYYTRADSTIRVTRYLAGGDLDDPAGLLTLESAYQVLTDLPHEHSHHNGGGLEFGPDEMLYVSVGDDGTDCAMMDTTLIRGCILRLDVSALPDTGQGPPDRSLLVPADNPHVGAGSDFELVYCHGLRNPFSFHPDPVTGKLAIGDVGWDDFEEVDVALGGENFGWGFREGFLVRTPVFCSEPGGPGSQTYDDPIYVYPHSPTAASVIVGPIYHAVGGPYDFPPAYEGAIFFDDLYQEFIRVLVPDGSGWALMDSVPGQPSAEDWARNLGKISNWEVGPDGALYYLRYSYTSRGELRRIVHYPVAATEGPPEASLRFAVFPNPSPSGSLRVLWDAEPQRVEVFDLLGRRVASLSVGVPRGVSWDRRDAGGDPVPPGVYWIRGQFEKGAVSRRVVLL